MQYTDPNVINYNFLKETTVKDRIPSWMNDNLFNSLQNTPKKVVTSGIHLNQKQEPICAECGSKLNYNEVAYCATCRQKFNNIK